jgi:hypothetical protein
VSFKASVFGRTSRVGHGGDTMVREQFRGRGVMGTIARHILATDHEFEFRIGFPSDQAARLWEKYGASKYLGRMDRWIRCETDRSMGRCVDRSVPRLLRPIAPAAHRWAKRRAIPPGTGVTINSLALDGEVDDLAERSTRFAPCIRIRDAAYLKWRWLDQPGPEWSLVGARDRDGHLTGWAVYGIDNRRPARLNRGFISDVLAQDPLSLRSLLATAADRLTAAGSDLVALDYVDPRPWSRKACSRAGFLRRGEGLNVVCRSLSPQVDARVEELANWYLTRSDSDLS